MIPVYQFKWNGTVLRLALPPEPKVKQNPTTPSKLVTAPTCERKKTQHTFCALLCLWLLCHMGNDYVVFIGEMTMSSSLDLHVGLQSLMIEKNAYTERGKR